MIKKFLGLQVFLIIICVLSLLILLFHGKLFPKNEKVESYIYGDQEIEDVGNKELITSISGYELSWIEIDNNEDILLFSNLEEKLSSKEAKERNNCKSLVSGSFYDEQGKHIGLFVLEGKIINEFVKSSIFNGFLSIDLNGKAFISTGEPKFPYLAVQSGPVLIDNRVKRTLKIDNDHNSRRIVAAVDDENKLYFLVLFDKTNLIKGPLLSELPDLIKRFSEEKNFKISDALNLDGGSHSAFISDKISLTELSTIGSYFCIQN